MGPKRQGQSSRLCGQAIQVASCGSHSAGMRQPRSAGTDFMVLRAWQAVPGPAPCRRTRCTPGGLSAMIQTSGRVAFPPPAGPPPAEFISGAAAMVAGNTILLVDDDPDILGAMELTF